MPKIAQIIRDTALGRDYIAVDRNGGLWSGEIETVLQEVPGPRHVPDVPAEQDLGSKGCGPFC